MAYVKIGATRQWPATGSPTEPLGVVLILEGPQGACAFPFGSTPGALLGSFTALDLAKI